MDKFLIWSIFLYGYYRLLRAAARYAKRKTGSNLIAMLAIIGVLFLSFGDVGFRRWYHKEVLCKREDVGIKIFAKAKLSKEFWDETYETPDFIELPDQNNIPPDKPFAGRFTKIIKSEREGTFPLTEHIRWEVGVVDLESEQQLSRFVDYQQSSLPWWLTPLRLVNPVSGWGWLFIGTRGMYGPSCFKLASGLRVRAQKDVFEKSSVAGEE